MSAVTSTGLEEMRAACQQLPAAVTAALREVAQATAKRMMANSKAILQTKEVSDRTALIDAIVLEENAANREFRVISNPPPGQPKNVTIWNEYGAVGRIVTARYYMRDAAEAERDQYRRDLEAASADAVAKVLG